MQAVWVASRKNAALPTLQLDWYKVTLSGYNDERLQQSQDDRSMR